MKNMKLITEAWKRFLNEVQSWPKTVEEAEASWPQVGKLYFSPAVYGDKGQRSTAEMEVLVSDQERNSMKVDIGPAFGKYGDIESKFIIHSYSNEGDPQQYAKIEYSILSNWSISGITVGAKNSKGVPSALYQINNILGVIYKPEFKNLIQPSSVPSSVDRLRKALEPLAVELRGKVGDVSLARGVNSTEPPLKGIQDYKTLFERFPIQKEKLLFYKDGNGWGCQDVAFALSSIMSNSQNVTSSTAETIQNQRTAMRYIFGTDKPTEISYKLEGLGLNYESAIPGVNKADTNFLMGLYYLTQQGLAEQGTEGCKQLKGTLELLVGDLNMLRANPKGVERGDIAVTRAAERGRGYVRP